jgi:NAD(P)-dependent dehydrogenase (short-subunit alcohol dehydrogenase family)
MLDDLTGRVVFITGGAQGIGRGMARAFAAEGALPVIVDIDDAARRRTMAELDAPGFALDVRDRDAWERVVAEVESTVGPISVLCNNAGVGGGASVTQMTYAMWDWVLGVNIGGVVNGIQTVVPRMLERGTGHIVNTASGAGLVSTDGTGFMYNTSKYAVVGLSECIRHDLDRRGIGVSVLCPGPVATDIFEHTEAGRPDRRTLTPKQQESFDRTNRWLHREGKDPDDVGWMVVAGVKANALYIHTDRSVERAVLKRAQRIVDAMPED